MGCDAKGAVSGEISAEVFKRSFGRRKSSEGPCKDFFIAGCADGVMIGETGRILENLEDGGSGCADATLGGAVLGDSAMTVCFEDGTW